MVKAGFIVEGASERIVVESPMFRGLLRACGYELVTPVVDAKGGGNLLPQNIEAFIARLDTAGAERIFVLTDLEDEVQVATVRERVAHQRIDFAFIAVKALEAWYLADSVAMNAWLGTDDFHEPTPEATPDKPWERLKQVAAERGKRGPGSKVAFATKVTKHWGFTIENASAHPACPSAQELIEYFRPA
ncbi:DUF4276 family protein [Pseudomonas aeruginosa]